MADTQQKAFFFFFPPNDRPIWLPTQVYVSQKKSQCQLIFRCLSPRALSTGVAYNTKYTYTWKERAVACEVTKLLLDLAEGLHSRPHLHVPVGNDSAVGPTTTSWTPSVTNPWIPEAHRPCPGSRPWAEMNCVSVRVRSAKRVRTQKPPPSLSSSIHLPSYLWYQSSVHLTSMYPPIYMSIICHLSTCLSSIIPIYPPVYQSMIFGIYHPFICDIYLTTHPPVSLSLPAMALITTFNDPGKMSPMKGCIWIKTLSGNFNLNHFSRKSNLIELPYKMCTLPIWHLIPSFYNTEIDVISIKKKKPPLCCLIPQF